jgi:thiamine-phosphate pyrophosphorylase
MKLVVLSPESADPREPAVLAALFAAGLERYHVRKPHWSAHELETWLSALPAEWRPRLVLHQHHPLVIALGLGGCHWRDDESAPLAPPARGLTSRSCHGLATLRTALGCYDSVFLGPVFPSISKPGHGPWGNFRPDAAATMLSLRSPAARRTTVFALGGVTAQNALHCRALGFDGVAVLGAVWQAADPVRAFVQLQTTLHRHAA